MFKNPITLSIAMALSSASLGLAALPAQGAETTATSVKAMNPFFQQSTLDLQYPHFDRIKDADFAPAFDRGMADNTREIEAIANSKKKPTFENTILAMESSGQLLRRALARPGAEALAGRFLPIEANYPALGRWLARIEALPGYDRTYPPHWR